MEMKKLFVLFAVFLAVSGMAMAIRGATLDGSMTDLTRWTGATSTANDTTEGGNITYGNLNGSSLTDRWAGYFGNISGANIYLTDSVGGTTNYLYSWAVAGANQTGEVCVSTNASFAFSVAEASTGADIDTAYSWASGADTGANTFTGTGCSLIFEEQGVTVASTAYADGDSGGSSFYTCVVDDGAVAADDDFAFCTNITVGGTNYLGGGAEYELVVPASDATPTSSTLYWFFIEIN